MNSLKDNIKIGILLATYNGEKYITEQLESIKHQSYGNFSVYIHDDGSIDRTIMLVKEFCKSDNRFHLIDAPSCGSAKENFFFLMSCVKDEKYIMFSDQDDYWNDNKISLCLEKMMETEKDTKVPICIYSNLEVVDDNLETINTSFYDYSGKKPYKNDLPSLIMNNVVVGCTMMINLELLNRGLSDVDHDLIFMHDWWLALIASMDGKIIYIDQALIKYRQHSNNVVGAHQKTKLTKKIVNLTTTNNRQNHRERFQRSIRYSIALDKVIVTSKYKKLLQEMAEIHEHCWLFRSFFFLKNRLISTWQIWKTIWL